MLLVCRRPIPRRSVDHGSFVLIGQWFKLWSSWATSTLLRAFDRLVICYFVFLFRVIYSLWQVSLRLPFSVQSCRYSTSKLSLLGHRSGILNLELQAFDCVHSLHFVFNTIHLHLHFISTCRNQPPHYSKFVHYSIIDPPNRAKASSRQENKIPIYSPDVVPRFYPLSLTSPTTTTSYSLPPVLPPAKAITPTCCTYSNLRMYCNMFLRRPTR